MRSAAALALIAAVFLSACGEGKAPAQTGTLRPLDTVAGHALLATEHPRTMETFACNGDWLFRDPSQHHNGSYISYTAREDTGSYTFEDGVLCVTASDGDQTCRTLLQGRGNIVVAIDASTTAVGKRYARMMVGGVGVCSPTRLTTEQLRQIIPGAHIEVENPAHDASSRYDFYCDGTWRGVGGQGEPGGNYAFYNDMFCIAGERSCRALYQTADGDYLISANSSRHGEPGDIIVPYPLTPASTRCASQPSQ